MNEQQMLRKQERRRRRKIRRIITTVVLAVLAAAVTLILTLTIPRVKMLKSFDGEYSRRIDITDKVAANASVWLKDVEGADIDAEWVRSKTDGISAEIRLNFTPDGLKKGSFTETLDDESYAACVDEAYRLTGECLRELIIKRLTAVGYAETMSNEEADALITEALGMPLDSFIRNAGISIAPDPGEISSSINRSGEYRISGKTIEWLRDGEQKNDVFSVTSDTLSIPDAGFIYTRNDDNGNKATEKDETEEEDNIDKADETGEGDE